MHTVVHGQGVIINNIFSVTVRVIKGLQFFFNCLHTKSSLVTQFLKPDTQSPELHTPDLQKTLILGLRFQINHFLDLHNRNNLFRWIYTWWILNREFIHTFQ